MLTKYPLAAEFLEKTGATIEEANRFFEKLEEERPNEQRDNIAIPK